MAQNVQYLSLLLAYTSICTPLTTSHNHTYSTPMAGRGASSRGSTALSRSTSIAPPPCKALPLLVSDKQPKAQRQRQTTKNTEACSNCGMQQRLPLLHFRYCSPLMHTFLFNARQIFSTSYSNYGRPVCGRACNSLISSDFPLVLFFRTTLATFSRTKAANLQREKCNHDHEKPTCVCWPTWDGRIRLPCARLDGHPCHTPYRRGHTIPATPSHHVSTLLQL